MSNTSPGWNSLEALTSQHQPTSQIPPAAEASSLDNFFAEIDHPSSFSETISTLTRGLQLCNEQEFVQWFCSPLFQAHWEVYADEYLKPALDKAVQRNQSQDSQLLPEQDLADILRALYDGESGGRQKYSNVYGVWDQKRDWTGVDHAAFSLYHCTFENLVDRDGALHDKRFGLAGAVHAVWMVVRWAEGRIRAAHQEAILVGKREEVPSEKNLWGLTEEMAGWGLS